MLTPAHSVRQGWSLALDAAAERFQAAQLHPAQNVALSRVLNSCHKEPPSSLFNSSPQITHSNLDLIKALKVRLFGWLCQEADCS